MANKTQNDEIQDDQLFSDLLRNSRFSSLQFEEPEVTTFDMGSVFQDPSLNNTKSFGKRISKLTKSQEETDSQSSLFSQKEKDDASLSSYESSNSTSTSSQDSKEASFSTPEETNTAFQPKTFAQLLHSSLYKDSNNTPKELDLNQSSLDFYDQPIQNTSMTMNTSAQDLVNAATAWQEEQNAMHHKEKESKVQRLFDDEDNEEAVYDPSASLVDDYHYDEYVDKKRFSTTDYKKVEEYLANESLNGFHFSRNEGRKYYFYKGKPHNYYYKVLYFAQDPGSAFWNDLTAQGWSLISQEPSRHKKDAGWYIVRNEKKVGELPKDIKNEEEKERYFLRLASSCRSTLLLLAIVMVCCAVAIWLQYRFKGYIVVMIASGILFVITLWTFLVYAKMLAQARKQASLLSARMRLAENDPKYKALQQAQDGQNVS